MERSVAMKFWMTLIDGKSFGLSWSIKLTGTVVLQLLHHSQTSAGSMKDRDLSSGQGMIQKP
jgi:hypothetical protein